jgi:hypothetical protein
MCESKSDRQSTGCLVIVVVLFLFCGTCDDQNRKIRNLDYEVQQLKRRLDTLEDPAVSRPPTVEVIE